MKRLLIVLLGILVLQSCSSSYKKNPVDELIVKMSDVKPYSIILQDMDVDGSFSQTYLHKYKIITEDSEGVPQEKITDWKQVPEQFFNKNENNLGMEIVSKNSEGKISKSAAPPGYGNYVGNSQYGEWRTGSNGNSFWSFYGKYMMMSTMFDLMRRPYYRNDYNHYRSGGYYGNRSYYGQKSSNGSYRYGTNSSYTKQTRPSFFARKASKRGWSQSSRRTSTSTKSTRSRSSSTRSRSGGFGK